MTRKNIQKKNLNEWQNFDINYKINIYLKERQIM